MRTMLSAAFATALLSLPALAQVGIPAHSSTYNGYSRGYNFTAQTTFFINQVGLPPEAMQAGDTAGFLIRVNGNVALHSIGNAGPNVATSILVNPGDVVDVIGNWSPAAPGSFTAHNSYGSSAPYATTIEGVPHTLNRTGWQWDIGDPAYAGSYLAPTSGSIGRVFIWTNPPAGLYPRFDATPTTGGTPLTVQFTDNTFTSDPGGVLAWAWDFDNDTVVDSTVQNPSHTYTTCGTYSVSLTVVDALHGPQTLTKTNYIVTDAVVADFTYALIAPGVVQFTDTSVPTPTSWAWDLDGDTVVDSTVQNPVHVYTSTAPVNVTLTASRLCGAPDTTTKSVIPALELPTIFTGGNGLSGAGSGNVFDLDVTAPTGINITGITMAPYSTTLTVGAPLTCEIWVTDAPGGIMGGSPVNHSVQALWRLAATATGNFNGGTFTAPVPVVMTLNQRFFLPPGNYSMGVRLMECGVAYTNGNGTTVPGSGTNQTYSNGDLTIRAGIGKSPLFAASGNNPRVWNGSLSYDRPDFGGLSGLGFFGAGCPNSLLQISKQTITGLPTLGSTLSVTYDNLPLSVVISVLGFSNTVSSFGPLPLDLGAFGAPGCPARVSADSSTLLIGAGNTANYSLALPNNPAFQGMKCFLQGFVLDPPANTLGVVTSDATGGAVGL